MSLNDQEAARAQLGEARFAEFSRACATILREHEAACDKLLREPGRIQKRMAKLDDLDREQVRRFKAVWAEYDLPAPDPLPPGW